MAEVTYHSSIPECSACHVYDSNYKQIGRFMTVELATCFICGSHRTAWRTAIPGLRRVLSWQK